MNLYDLEPFEDSAFEDAATRLGNLTVFINDPEFGEMTCGLDALLAYLATAAPRVVEVTVVNVKSRPEPTDDPKTGGTD